MCFNSLQYDNIDAYGKDVLYCELIGRMMVHHIALILIVFDGLDWHYADRLCAVLIRSANDKCILVDTAHDSSQGGSAISMDRERIQLILLL